MAEKEAAKKAKAAKKAATGGTKKRANEEMDAPSLPRANSVRHYIVDALCAGMVEREAIVAHATKASGGRVARADLVTALGKEKAVSVPLWSQEDTAYTWTDEGRAAARAGGMKIVGEAKVGKR